LSSYVAKREKLDRLLRTQLKRSGEVEQHHEQLRQHFQEVGPVVMVNELKLTVKGRRIQLSDDQIKFLNDLWTRRVRFAILVAGRGAGKTLCLAILGLWFIVCHDEFDISSMGGSMAHSEKIQGYISEWERKNKFIRKSIMKNVLGSGGRHAHVTTTSYSQMLFMSCSVTSVMGPHTQILFIDEVCAGEEKGNIKAIKGSFGEVSTSSDITVVLTSTAHYLFGFFKEVLDHPEEHGFTVYCWSIAKHESGIEDPYQIYRFKTGWKPNVPWVTQRGIDFLRKNLTDDEWLVDALGGVGIGTGSVVHPEDLDVAICSKCEVCEPYKFPKCTLVTEEQFKQITERRLGIDYGDVAPNAFVVVGRNKEDVYVLYANELTAVRDYEVLDHVDKLVPQWNVEILYPDPENYSMNNMLEDRGHTIHKLYSQHGGQEKLKYVRNVKWHFENQKLHIPKAYDKLINSIQGLTYDEKGNIRKINDHSWDSLMHSLSGYYRDTQKYLLTTQRKFIESLWGDERDTETFSSDTKLPWENKEL